MIKRNLIIFGFISLLGASVYANSQDIIPLENKEYKKHKKAIVLFEHKKHYNDFFKQYSELYNSQCGECHHNKDNEPLTELKDGDDVQKCIECHKIPSEAPKGKKAKVKLSKKEKINNYHAEALHANCKGCHKKFNKKYKPKKAPTTCSKCHIKKEK